MRHDGRQELGPDEPAAAPGHLDDVANRQSKVAFGLGALVGIVLFGLAWATISALSNDPTPDGRAHQARIFDEPATVKPPRGPTRLQRCASVAAALAVPVRAAGPAMDQWEVHVGAMNKLVVGAISLQQATAFWNQTRVGAKHLIADFHEAEKAPEQQDVSCPWRRAGHHHALPALRSCAQQVEANEKALGAARTAVATWEMHVHDMEALRAGKLSPATATSMWLTMWKQGLNELRAFHAAERTATRQAGCRAG